MELYKCAGVVNRPTYWIKKSYARNTDLIIWWIFDLISQHPIGIWIKQLQYHHRIIWNINNIIKNHITWFFRLFIKSLQLLYSIIGSINRWQLIDTMLYLEHLYTCKQKPNKLFIACSGDRRGLLITWMLSRKWLLNKPVPVL